MGGLRGIVALRSSAQALPAAARRFAAAILLAALAGCGGGAPAPRPQVDTIVSRVITLDLWTGGTQTGPGPAGSGALPAIDVETPSGASIQGPFKVEDPAGGARVMAYRRTSPSASGQRLQLLTVTAGGAGLGRILDRTPGLPERHFAGDVVFPLGPWKQGEIRQFEATEFTLAGPAQRRVTLEILDLDFVYKGATHSLAYRLTVRDAAARVIRCETSVYSPGAGLVRLETSSSWLTPPRCGACPCPG
jgi:hypothetical protein